VHEAEVFGPKAIAGLSVMKTGTGDALDALFTRMIEFTMTRPRPGYVLHKLREQFPGGINGWDIGAHLHMQLATWAAQERDALAGTLPETPQGVELRDEEKWLPLLAVAARAEVNRQDRDNPETGDDWAALAWEACVDMSLYGGIPGVDEETADMFGQIAAHLDAEAAESVLDSWGDEPEPEQAPPGPWRACCMVQDHPGQETPLQWLDGTWPDLASAQRACEDIEGQPLTWETTPSGNVGATITTPEGIKTWAVTLAAGKD
jgi:hypothetical protein